MFMRFLARATRKLAISVFALLEVLGLPREGKRRPEDDA
jgi:hypothetical protein